jgi:histidinol phosphatase-like PHP family hydrolase
MYCRAPFRLWIGLSDIEKVLSACGKHGVAVEINAHPWRLDLDWRWHQAALGFGCMMSINPDAHSIPGLDHMHWGVEMARRGRSALKPGSERDAAAADHAPSWR